jgi:hypothetical protein
MWESTLGRTARRRKIFNTRAEGGLNKAFAMHMKPRYVSYPPVKSKITRSTEIPCDVFLNTLVNTLVSLSISPSIYHALVLRIEFISSILTHLHHQQVVISR